MPIVCETIIEPISEEEFHKIDYKIMDLVFEVHNELGRFCNEKIFQNRLALLCEKNGFNSVSTEVPIVISFNGFIKRYFIDILINNAVIYELKTVKSLINEHHRQTLNYLLLTGINHGKIINFGTSSIEKDFVSTKLNLIKRHSFFINSDDWHDIDNNGKSFKNLIINLLNDWGAFLDIQLFYDAIVFFCGGINNVLGNVELFCDNKIVGKQKIHLLNNKVAFRLSGITKEKKFYRKHLVKFLNHTKLDALQWVNFNHHNIEFETIFNKNN